MTKEERSAYNKQYFQQNKFQIYDRSKDTRKAWLESHKEEVKAYQKQWREEHKEHLREYKREYNKKIYQESMKEQVWIMNH